MRRHTFDSLCIAPPEILTGTMGATVTPDPESLAGWEFRGFTPGDSPAALLLRKHRMGFYRLKNRRGSTGLGGYVIPCHDGPPSGRWIDRLDGPGGWKLGWFTVEPGTGGRFPRALTLDFSRGGRAPRFHPQNLVRQYLAQIHPDDPDLLVCALEVRAGRQVRHLGVSVLARDRLGTVGI
jgi:hypothetical protein